MEVNVSVSVGDIEGVDLTTPIQVVRVYDHEVEEYVEKEITLGAEVAKKIHLKLVGGESFKNLEKKYVQIRDEEIRTLIQPMLIKMLNEPLQKTNVYGEPTGQTTSVREIMMQEFAKMLGESTDSYNRGPTVLQKLVREEIERLFISELKEAMKSEKAKVVAAVRAKGAELISQAVKEGLGGG